MGIGIELIMYILASVFIGRYIDSHFDFGGKSVGIAVVVALIVWFVRITIMLKKVADAGNEPSHDSEKLH